MRTDQPTEDDLDALLARGRLGVAARDRIFDAVVAGLGRAKPQRLSWTARTSLALVTLAGAAAAVLLVAPRVLDRRDELRAKGAVAPAVEVDVGCPAGALEACPAGSTLVFAVDGQAEGYLAAWAEPRGGGERVWYFSADAETPRVYAAGGTTALRRAIRIGPEHPPGAYVVHVRLTREPRTRAELLAGAGAQDALARREVELRVTAEPGAGARP